MTRHLRSVFGSIIVACLAVGLIVGLSAAGGAPGPEPAPYPAWERTIVAANTAPPASAGLAPQDAADIGDVTMAGQWHRASHDRLRNDGVQQCAAINSVECSLNKMGAIPVDMKDVGIRGGVVAWKYWFPDGSSIWIEYEDDTLSSAWGAFLTYSRSVRGDTY